MNNDSKVIDYLLKRIHEYKSGTITKEEFYEKAGKLVSSLKKRTDNAELAEILYDWLPDVCLFYIDEEDDERSFRKEIENIELHLRNICNL